MKYSLAPMEGITGYVYRNAYHACFAPMDRYYTPFIAPKQDGGFSSKELNDILPEHNQGKTVIPQILTNKSGDFLIAAQWLKGYGYTEVNLNLGCPSPTVVSKGKGAGFLGYKEELDRFLKEVCDGMENLHMTLSVKTRLGVENSEEFEQLLSVYGQYPLTELIIHPRVLKDYYKNTPHMETFVRALEKSAVPVWYNGDVFDAATAERVIKEAPGVEGLMMGRGILKNPFLLEEIKTEEKPSMEVCKKRLQNFHGLLYTSYQEIMSGDRNVLFKMKELWSYLIQFFPETPDRKKLMKKIQKAQKAGDYEAAVQELFGRL